MLSDGWFSRYGLLENFNASVTRTRTRTGTGTGTWTTGVTAIALCTSCSRAKNDCGGAVLTKNKIKYDKMTAEVRSFSKSFHINLLVHMQNVLILKHFFLNK